MGAPTPPKNGNYEKYTEQLMTQKNKGSQQASGIFEGKRLNQPNPFSQTSNYSQATGTNQGSINNNTGPQFKHGWPVYILVWIITTAVFYGAVIKEELFESFSWLVASLSVIISGIVTVLIVKADARALQKKMQKMQNKK